MKPLFAFIAGCALTALVAVELPRAEAAPKKEVKAPEISADMMRIFGKPVIDRCLVDGEYRRDLMGKMEEAFGKRTMAQLTYLSVLDSKPQIAGRPLVNRAIKRNLGL
jgi:hypothetical protein